MTTKPGKLFITFFDEPRVPFALPAMKNAVKRAYRLADGAADRGQEGRREDAAQHRASDLDPMATVIVVEIDGALQDRAIDDLGLPIDWRDDWRLVTIERR